MAQEDDWKPLESRKFAHPGKWETPNLEYEETKPAPKRKAPKKEKPKPKPKKQAPKPKKEKKAKKEPKKKEETQEEAAARQAKVLKAIEKAPGAAGKVAAAKAALSQFKPPKGEPALDKPTSAEQQAEQQAKAEVKKVNDQVAKVMEEAEGEMKKRFEGVPKDMLPEIPLAKKVGQDKLKEVMGDAKVPDAAAIKKLMTSSNNEQAAAAAAGEETQAALLPK